MFLYGHRDDSITHFPHTITLYYTLQLTTLAVPLAIGSTDHGRGTWRCIIYFIYLYYIALKLSLRHARDISSIYNDNMYIIIRLRWQRKTYGPVPGQSSVTSVEFRNDNNNWHVIRWKSQSILRRTDVHVVYYLIIILFYCNYPWVSFKIFYQTITQKVVGTLDLQQHFNLNINNIHQVFYK